MSLPAPRTILASLLRQLTSIPPAIPNPTDPPSNPFHHLPSQARSLLATLHVLIPAPTLLQALDLLDRGLVTRVVHSSLPVSSSPSHHSTIDHGGRRRVGDAIAEEPREVGEEQRKTIIYLVRSSQTQRHRHATGSEGSGMTYVIRLEAWNCSCAAFAFACFPGGGFSFDTACLAKSARGFNLGSETEAGNEQGEDEDEMEGDEQIGKGGRRECGDANSNGDFGGRLNDQSEAGGDEPTPCCKHILACLLADRWEDVLASYVKERVVGRDEMAGLGGEI